jgi:periplasmic protein TonB
MNQLSSRYMTIAGAVVLFHIVALWALQTGLLQRAVEAVVQVQLLSTFIEPLQPKPEPLPPVQKTRLAPQQATAVKAQALPPAPMPQAIADPNQAPHAPTGLVADPAPLRTITALAMPEPIAAPPQIEMPSSDAAYLQNPTPVYPAISRRMGEQGKVVIRVLIDVDGTAQQAQVQQSSSFARLDQAALTTVARWRYVPGKRAGVPEAMWFNVPINFVLE